MHRRRCETPYIKPEMLGISLLKKMAKQIVVKWYQDADLVFIKSIQKSSLKKKTTATSRNHCYTLRTNTFTLSDLSSIRYVVWSKAPKMISRVRNCRIFKRTRFGQLEKCKRICIKRVSHESKDTPFTSLIERLPRHSIKDGATKRIRRALINLLPHHAKKDASSDNN